MRLLGCIITVFILIISAGLWSNHALQVSTNQLTRQIELVSMEIENKDWETAVIRTDKLEQTWKEEAQWWPVVLDHQEMDNIEFSLAKVKAYVISRNLSLSLGQLSEVRLMIEHIPEKEAVTLENIL